MRKMVFRSILILLAILFMSIIFVRINNKNERLERKNNKELILFLGDSLTARYDLNKYYSKYYVVNSGIGGNITTDILDDMNKRVYKYKPKKVFLLIGVNDLLFTENSNNSIKNNIEEIINKINDNTDSKIFLESIYPVNVEKLKSADKDINNRIVDLNKKIKKLCDKKCTYINIHDDLTNKNGNLKSLYTKDGIHLNRFGYFKITKKLRKYIK